MDDGLGDESSRKLLELRKYFVPIVFPSLLLILLSAIFLIGNISLVTNLRIKIRISLVSFVVYHSWVNVVLGFVMILLDSLKPIILIFKFNSYLNRPNAHHLCFSIRTVFQH